MSVVKHHDTDSVLASVVVSLPPGYFAFVMATGVVAIDLHSAHHHWLSLGLTTICGTAFLVLVALSALRISWFGERIRLDARNPATTFTFLSFVAGCIVLAGQPPFAVHDIVLMVLGGTALAAWLLMLPTAVRCVLRVPVRSLHHIACGNWLIAVVSTQALSIDASMLTKSTGQHWLANVGFMGWVLGCALYLVIIVPVTGRIVLAVRHNKLETFTPDFWITMGALAITTLSTASLLTALLSLGYLTGAIHFVRTVGAVAWIVATTWIVPLIILEVIKVRRLGMPRYHVARWSTVFPMAMYAAGSTALAAHISWAAMRDGAKVFTWLALIVWTLTMWGLARRRPPNAATSHAS